MTRSTRGGAPRRILALIPFVASLALTGASYGQTQFFKNSDAPRLAPRPARELTPEQQKRLDIGNQEHAREMQVLGLKALRSPRDPRDPDAPNAANYDEALADPYPRSSDVLRLNGGAETTTAAVWWAERRPEIAEAFDREIYGRVPANVPGVTWQLVNTTHDVVDGYKVTTEHLIGHVDNSMDPAIKVDIGLDLVLPANVKGRVPVTIEYSYRATPRPPDPTGPTDPDWKGQILALGWGYALLDTVSIQPDDGAGLFEGIIGLTNKGQPRKMDDWGANRAWAWGADRAVDYLVTDPHVAGDELSIEGMSHFGKAALVAMAYDQRIAVGFISSSGAGGAKLLRRDYGETVEDLNAPNEYFWFAGNFMKYAADPLTANDLPADADALIAMCAPRPVFIAGGANPLGDAWVDARGMFIAASGAGPAYALLGKKPLQTDQFPPLETPLLDGDIAFRQHHYGHTPAPNWKWYLQFARKYFRIER
jgi:hypothetical protein